MPDDNKKPYNGNIINISDGKVGEPDVVITKVNGVSSEAYRDKKTGIYFGSAILADAVNRGCNG